MFLTTAVWTRDEASGQIRRFASVSEDERRWVHDGWDGGDRFDYLRYLTQERPKHKFRAYDKSRRMMFTWWLLACYLYEMMTEANTLSAVASDKLEKSAYLLGPDRMQFIYDHIPPVSPTIEARLRAGGMDVGPFKESLWPNKPLLVFSGKQGQGWTSVRCEERGTAIMAFASGESQMQQYTLRRVLMDEFPRWQWQEESLRNIQPTIQGGGEADMVCTPELGSFAQSFLFDEEG